MWSNFFEVFGFMLALHRVVSDMVKGRWEGFRFMKKLRALEGNLKVWSREAFRNIRTKKKNIIARIDEIDTLELEGPLDSSLKG